MHTAHCILFYLSKSLSRFFFGDITLGDVLLEWREQEPEQGNVLPEQASCVNATGVKESECYTSLLVEAPVELLHCEHVADFAVLVGLGTVKLSTVDHGRAVDPVDAPCKSPQIPKVGLWRYISSQSVCVP